MGRAGLRCNARAYAISMTPRPRRRPFHREAEAEGPTQKGKRHFVQPDTWSTAICPDLDAAPQAPQVRRIHGTGTDSRVSTPFRCGLSGFACPMRPPRWCRTSADEVQACKTHARRAQLHLQSRCSRCLKRLCTVCAGFAAYCLLRQETLQRPGGYADVDRTCVAGRRH